MTYFVQQLILACPLAALYGLLAFGYALSFGLTRRTELAYGAFFAFGGQMAALFYSYGWDQLILVFPAALAFGAGMALLFSALAATLHVRYVVLDLDRGSRLAALVAGLGMVLALMETARLASNTRDLWIPPFLTARIAFPLAEGQMVGLTLNQILSTLLFVLEIMTGLIVQSRTAYGRRWRALADDRLAAGLVGISVIPTIAVTAMVSLLIAAEAGVVAAFQYGNMDFGSGLTFGLKVLVVAGAGGAGEVRRAVAGAVLMGFAETLFSAYAPLMWRDPVLFAGLIFVLVITGRERPQAL